MKKNSVCLVTGGAGFIGSNLVEKLSSMNNVKKIIVIDNLSNAVCFYNPIEDYNKVEFWRGDIRVNDVNRDVASPLPEIFKQNKIDYLFHLAALGSVQRSIDDPYETNDVNVNGTLNLLEICRRSKYKIKKFIYSSSSSIYGGSKFPLSEMQFPNPMSPYALSKYTGEKYCEYYSKFYNVPTVSLRYFNVFGKNQNPNSIYSAVIPIFMKNILESTKLTIYGDGKQRRDFTHVDNVVQANILACNYKNENNHNYNISCSNSISILELVEKLKKITGADIKYNFKDARPGDVLMSHGYYSLAKDDLGYNPIVSVDEGLEKTWKQFIE